MTTDLRELLTQAMRDANTSEAWQASGGLLVPFAAYADAILALVDVEEQHGLTWPTGSGGIDWFDSEAEAREELRLRHEQVPDLGARTELRRRYVLRTKPEAVDQAETVHRCPLPGSGTTPCCGRTPFELDPKSRLTTEDALVTCTTRPADPTA